MDPMKFEYEPKVRISGTASLKEVYKDPKNVIYYAVISATAYAPSSLKILPQNLVDVEIPLTAEQYSRLKKELSESTAEQPILRVKGNLEIILGYVSFA